MFFVDLRYREGITQLVFDPKNPELSAINTLRDESVIEVEGEVTLRNSKLKTGKIEVVVKKLVVHNICEVLPFPLEDNKADVGEDLRLTYRYLDLHRSKNFRRLRMRHRATCAIRDYLDSNGYLEIETPYLFKTTP